MKDYIEERIFGLEKITTHHTRKDGINYFAEVKREYIKFIDLNNLNKYTIREIKTLGGSISGKGLRKRHYIERLLNNKKDLNKIIESNKTFIAYNRNQKLIKIK